MLLSDGRLLEADVKAMKAQLEAVRKGVDEDREALRLALTRAEKKSQEVEEALDRLNQSARKTDTDLSVQLDKVSQTVQELSGKLDEAQVKLSQIEKKESSATISDKAASQTQETSAEESENNSAGSDKKGELPQESSQAVEVVLKSLHAAHKNEDSIRLAKEFLNKWPKEEGKSDVIRLALGERYLEDKQYQKAVIEFKKVLDDFPKGKKTDQAMFKIGETFTAMGYFPDAKVFYEELIRRHPRSIFVKQAQLKIRELEQKAMEKPKKGKKGK